MGDSGAVHGRVTVEPAWSLHLTGSTGPSRSGIPDAPEPHVGQLVAGNIDLANRPIYHSSDGTIATVRSIEIEEEGVHVVIPTVMATPARIVSNSEAIHIYQTTGKHLGKFDTEGNAETYAEALHVAQETYYSSTPTDIVTKDPSRLPFRWFQRIQNDQTELEVPNIKSISIDRSLDVDAASCEIVIYNQIMDRNTVVGNNSRELGSPGALSWNYGEGDAGVRWGQSQNVWNNVLIPNALLRTYAGYGGRDKTISGAVSDGNIMLSGVWLIDEVQASTDGMLTLKCRDMAKLLIEQQIFPPFMPAKVLRYFRFKKTKHTSPAQPYYDYTNPVQSGPGAEGPKYVNDIAISSNGAGYWLVGSDGGVFSFNTSFYGSRGSNTDDGPMTAIVADPLGRGYWLCNNQGGVFTFGDVAFYGSPHGIVVGTIRAMAAHPNGRGYWLVSSNGSVYSYGSVQYYGGNPVGASTIIDIVPTLNGGGYYLLDDTGHVYTFGNAVYRGGATINSPRVATGMALHPDGAGYYITDDHGTVTIHGSARTRAANGHWDPNNLHDPIVSIAVMPTGAGYILAGGDGGVFTFGDAPFWGSLPDDFTYYTIADGNYKDWSEIASDLLRWSGFLAYGDGQDNVYGNIESTGAWAEEDIPPDFFDKKPIIDVLNQIKEISGFIMWVDEEGAVRWTSPNWFNYGNFVETGTHVEQLVVIDEKYQLTDYTVSYSDASVRSEIIVSSYDPTDDVKGTITTRKTYESDLLRGMVRPAMWVNEAFLKQSEQERMLDQIGQHILFSFRQGTVKCVANPSLQIDDQIRIFERQTGETFRHYVRGIRSEMDLDTGTWWMTLTTNWLGDSLPTAPDGVGGGSVSPPVQQPTDPPYVPPPIEPPPPVTPPPVVVSDVIIAVDAGGSGGDL